MGIATSCSSRLRYQAREGWCVRVTDGGRDQWRWSLSTVAIVGNPKSVGESPAEAVTPQVFLEVKGGGPLVWRTGDPVGTQVVNVVVKMSKRGCAYLCR